MTHNTFVKKKVKEDRAVFEARFWHSYRILHFIACRVLGRSERAEEAVKNCWQTASRRPPRFEHEGEFRSWLLRVLIDEALALARENNKTPEPNVSPEWVDVEVLRREDNAESNIRTDDRNVISQGLSIAAE